MPFRAKIEKEQIIFPTIRASMAWEKWKETYEGARVEITEVKPTRSLTQNAYYWVYLEVIGQETGDNATDLHEVFKRELLPPVFKTIRGKEYKLPRSTTILNKTEFGEYMDKICALTNIPLPDPREAGYLPR